MFDDTDVKIHNRRTYAYELSRYAAGLVLEYYEVQQIPDTNIQKIIRSCRNCYNKFGTPDAKAAVEVTKQAGLNYINDPATQAIPEHLREQYDEVVRKLYSVTIATYGVFSTSDEFTRKGYMFTATTAAADVNDDIKGKIEEWKLRQQQELTKK